MADKVIRQNQKGEWVQTSPELVNDEEMRKWKKSLAKMPEIKRLIREIGE